MNEWVVILFRVVDALSLIHWRCTLLDHRVIFPLAEDLPLALLVIVVVVALISLHLVVLLLLLGHGQMLLTILLV